MMHSFIKVEQFLCMHTISVSSGKSLPGMKPFWADGKYILFTILIVQLAVHLPMNNSWQE